MADSTTVVEGKIKFREGKKWKSRWCVLRKPSPVADQLQVKLYKDVTEVVRHDAKAKTTFALDGFLGLEAGFALDREANVMAIVCQKHVFLMAFEFRENMIQFEIKIRQSLGEEHQFPVRVVKSPSSSRLPKDQLHLFIHDTRFCLLGQTPPKVFLCWNVEDLRRFGARDGKFIFEGGSRCGKGAGGFALQSEQAEDIADIINLASTGKMSNCHRKFKNRRRSSSIISPDTASELQCLNIAVAVTDEDLETFGPLTGPDGVLASPRQIESSPRQICQLIATVDTSDMNCECNSPAKSVLRPRSGSEYIVISRKSSRSFTSQISKDSTMSLSLSRIFNFESGEPPGTPHSIHQRLQHLRPIPTTSSHSLPSHSPVHTPQRSPSFSSVTSHSHTSLVGDPWEKDALRSSLPRSAGTTDQVPQSASSQPHPVNRSLISSPATAKDFHKKSAQSVTTEEEEESIFFPMDLSSNPSAPSSPLIVPEPIYVNIPPPTNPSPNNRTFSSSSSQSSVSPIRAGRHSLKSFLFRDNSRSMQSAEPVSATIPVQLKRSRSRHSESDANRSDRHALSLSRHRVSHWSTLPLSLQRSLSASKAHGREESRPKLTLTVPPEDIGSTVHNEKRPEQQQRISVDVHHASEDTLKNKDVLPQQYKVLERKYDKFAESSIISRRRQQYAALKLPPTEETLIKSENVSVKVHELPLHTNSLGVPILKSSGYKNIDHIIASKSHISPSEVCCKDVCDIHSVDGEMHSGISESKLAPGKSHVFSSAPNVYHSESPNSPHNKPTSVFSLPCSTSPPLPLPSRHPSSSPSSSPPLSPLHPGSDLSDSPPSYYAPSPPTSPPPAISSLVPPPLPARKPLLPIPSPAVSEPDNVSDSESEGELNYIEVDMSKPQGEAPKPPPVGPSRRSKRSKSKKEPTELRYAVIDMKATRALNQTRQEHVQARDETMRKVSSPLSRINSAPASSKRKTLSLVPRERKLSSGSLDSL